MQNFKTKRETADCRSPVIECIRNDTTTSNTNITDKENPRKHVKNIPCSIEKKTQFV